MEGVRAVRAVAPQRVARAAREEDARLVASCESATAARQPRSTAATVACLCSCTLPHHTPSLTRFYSSRRRPRRHCDRQEARAEAVQLGPRGYCRSDVTVDAPSLHLHPQIKVKGDLDKALRLATVLRCVRPSLLRTSHR
jgi:hypothetical protein